MQKRAWVMGLAAAVGLLSPQLARAEGYWTDDGWVEARLPEAPRPVSMRAWLLEQARGAAATGPDEGRATRPPGVSGR